MGRLEPPAWQLNAMAATLLGFLLDGPRTGWDLARDAKREIGNLEHHPEPGLQRAADPRGARAGYGTGGRHRFAGAASLRHHGRAPRGLPGVDSAAPGEELIRFRLLVSVLFAQHVEPDRLRRWLREHELVHLRRLDDYERQAAAPPHSARGGRVQTLRFGIEYERAVLRWFASAFDDLVERDDPAERLKGGT
jgi:hypothetical protein